MPTFAYQAVNSAGRLVHGAVEGADVLAAAAQLQQKGLLPLSVRVGAGEARAARSRFGFVRRRVTAGHRLVFARTLASLLAAGVPLDRSLAVSAELTESAVLREVLQEILRGVKGGKSLSAALETYPDIFPAFYVSMLRAGEASGNLAAVWAQLADYQESANELRSQLISALIYPALLVFVGGASILVLLEFVVPKFAVVFEQAGAALPLPTQVLLAVSGFIRQTWWLWFLGVPGLSFLLRRYLQTPAGHRRWDHFILAVPKLGTVVEQVLVARFARSLGTLLQGGVPMIRSLEIARQVVGNEKIGAAVEQAARGVKQGKGVARPLAETGAFPPLAIHLVGVGEETGRLDAMLLQLAATYEREVRFAIKNLVALFEPVMILVMGVLVGGIVISILLAIFSVNEIPL